jgi:hypothetical protein
VSEQVLVCGSRDSGDPEHARMEIHKRLQALPEGTTILHGGAHGVDMWVDAIAYGLGIKTRVYLADWEHYGRSAGILRNNDMLDLKPNLVIAFWNGFSRGTRHTISEARKRGIPVEVIPLVPTRLES